MSTSIITVEKLLGIEKTLEQEIHNQTAGKGGYQNVQVIIAISLNGEIVDWNSSRVKEIHLLSTTPTVYRKPLLPSGELVKLVFEADKVIHHPDEYIMEETSRTFNTYEEFLEYFTKRCREIFHGEDEDIFIWPMDKQTGFSINNIVEHEKIIRLDFCQLSILEKYYTIPEDTKIHIDHILCPLTVKREDVCQDMDNRLTIFCHKENMAEKLKTNDFDEIIKKQFGKEA